MSIFGQQNIQIPYTFNRFSRQKKCYNTVYLYTDNFGTINVISLSETKIKNLKI